MAQSTTTEDLRGLIKSCGVTQTWLAKASGMSRTAVRNILSGESDSLVGSLQALADALRVPWERVAAAFRESRRTASCRGR